MTARFCRVGTHLGVILHTESNGVKTVYQVREIGGPLYQELPPAYIPSELVILLPEDLEVFKCKVCGYAFLRAEFGKYNNCPSCKTDRKNVRPYHH